MDTRSYPCFFCWNEGTKWEGRKFVSYKDILCQFQQLMLYPCEISVFFISTLDVGLDMIHLVLAKDCFVIYMYIHIYIYYTYSSKRLGPAFLFSGMADILFTECGWHSQNCMRPVKTQRFPTKNDHVLKCGMIFHWIPDTWAHIALLQSVFLLRTNHHLAAGTRSYCEKPCGKCALMSAGPNAGTYTTYPIEKEIESEPSTSMTLDSSRQFFRVYHVQ